MHVGYMNEDIQYYLGEKEKEHGAQWSLVVEMSENDWQTLGHQAATVVDQAAGQPVQGPLRRRLQANTVVGFLLNLAEDNAYPDTKTMRDFLQICGTNFNPTIAVQPTTRDRVAVIISLAKKTIKENMSPRRRIDV